MNILKNYLELVKPGIIIGNILLIIGGFLFASRHVIYDLFLLIYSILGGSLVIASACVLNNIIDRDIDKKMQRTNSRVLSRNIISCRNAFIFSAFLGILGLFILGILVNCLSMIVSICGFLIYVILYTLIYKRTSIYSTLIGSFSGSSPSIIGYVAVSNTIDIPAILLFIIFIFWQMAHFYSISIFRIVDYTKANIPIFSVVKGTLITSKHIFMYIFSFMFFISLLSLFGYLSYNFLFFSSIINLYWLFLSYRNIMSYNHEKNAYQLFFYSILVIIVFDVLMVIDKYI